MSQGLKIYNEAGDVRLDTTMRLARYHSFYTGYLAADTSTTVSVPGLADDGTWSIAFEPQGGFSGSDVEVTVSPGSIYIYNGGNGSYYATSTHWNITIYRI
jgi:hypothetical protein